MSIRILRQFEIKGFYKQNNISLSTVFYVNMLDNNILHVKIFKYYILNIIRVPRRTHIIKGQNA